MKNRKGLTLVEIILSMALLGIIVIVFLTVFNTGNKNIIKAGNRTKDVLKTQSEIDEKIKNHNNEGKDTIIIDIPGIGEKEVKGSILVEEVNGIEITTFIPNKPSKRDE